MAGEPDWKFLTNYGLALLCIARDPGVRLRDIADRLGITERAAHRIVSALVGSGYVARERVGRRNTYELLEGLPIRALQLSELIGVIDQRSA